LFELVCLPLLRARGANLRREARARIETETETERRAVIEIETERGTGGNKGGKPSTFPSNKLIPTLNKLSSDPTLPLQKSNPTLTLRTHPLRERDRGRKPKDFH
jgi:hypothetical protein